MSVVLRINQLSDQLTPTDKIIADYIVANEEKISNFPTEVLAEESKTSVSAWNRFSKRIGYSGIKELKQEIIKSSALSENHIQDWIIKENDTLKVVSKKLISMASEVLDSTEKLLNYEELDKIIETMCQSRRILVFGVGGNSIICQDLLQKLTRIGHQVIFHQDMHVFFLDIHQATREDVILLISYSGETKETLFAAECAKERKIPIVSITGFNLESRLVKMATYSLYVPKTESELRLGAMMSRNSMLYLTDLLYLGVVLKKIEHSKETIVETHEIAKKLKGM